MNILDLIPQHITLSDNCEGQRLFLEFHYEICGKSSVATDIKETMVLDWEDAKILYAELVKLASIIRPHLPSNI